jgi:lysophospholipase
LFNAILLNLPWGNASTAQQVLESVLQAFSKAEEDIAVYPNPFQALNGSSNTVSQYPNLTLVDGVRHLKRLTNSQGEDLQNVPLWPLLQKERNVDVIFGVDSSADTQNWPNGTAYVATYEKFMLSATSDVVFPHVPDQQTYPPIITPLTTALSISASTHGQPFLDVTHLITLHSLAHHP